MIRILRRRLLLAAAASALLPMAWRRALAQGKDLELLRAPRHALVIGNSRYPAVPLRNPANDARAIGEELRRIGFEVSLGLDLTLEEMRRLVQNYGESLQRAKAVGLFYFAGHGVQLAWRNYLLPVDAAIGRMEDIQRSCVDVNTVIESIARASNPMNLIILDACRENPFGRDFRVEQKGLSQLDAPPGTLLAFATSPGNVASDGEGANGLYTENLLRELAVPEAKVEDVFKRVRLAVRLRSKGLQIPWESTSLEQDFWFIPPRELMKIADAEAAKEREAERARQEKIKAEQEAERARQEEQARQTLLKAEKEAAAERAQLAELARDARARAETEAAERARQEERAREERRKAEKAAEEERARAEQSARQTRAKAADPEELFKAELALWERIQDSRGAEPFVDYLMRYPSGRFAELAQLQLDRALARQGEKKIEVVSSEANPYSKGSATARTDYKVGDSYTYRRMDLFSKVVSGTYVNTVTQVTDTEVVFNGGAPVTDALGNVVKTPDGRRFTAPQLLPLEYALGKRWATRFEGPIQYDGSPGDFIFEFQITAREPVVVPAGTFNAFRLEGRGTVASRYGIAPQERRFWVAPDKSRRVIASDSTSRTRMGFNLAERIELVSFRES